MKILASALLLSFALITFAPLMLMLVPAQPAACMTKCGVEDEDASRAEDDSGCCPPEMCTPVQCVFCCFVCPVTADKIVVRIFDSAHGFKPGGKQFPLPGYAAECWQPPELA